LAGLALRPPDGGSAWVAPAGRYSPNVTRGEFASDNRR
jgi:hypothetical protein